MKPKRTEARTPRSIVGGHIFLVGFMGSGKSTVGPLLADALGLPFVDLDRAIEEQEERSVAEIFDRDGEERFREIERQALLDAVGRTASVIALGGGVFTQTENRRFVKEAGRSVWLRVRLRDATERCLNVGGRPLARDTERFQKLFYSRLSDYRRADISIDTSDRTPSEICRIIVEKLQQNS